MSKRVLSALSLVVLGLFLACSPGHDDPAADEVDGSIGTSRAQLRTAPVISQFAVYASNSVALMDRAAVHGGDVGVALAGSGPFLVSGYEVALRADARIDTDRDVLADRVLLKDRAIVGDVEATTITNQFGFFAAQYPLPPMPDFPSAAIPAPGSTAVSVSSGQTRSLDAGGYASVTVQGTLELTGGTYDLASLSLGNDAHVEVLAPSHVHIATRLSAGDRARVEPKAGTSLTAKDVALEVSGLNGTTGALTAGPKAVVLGNDTVVRALFLVPNGTLQTGQRTSATGALLARDVYVNLDAVVTFEDGFAAASCGACGRQRVHGRRVLGGHVHAHAGPKRQRVQRRQRMHASRHVPERRLRGRRHIGVPADRSVSRSGDMQPVDRGVHRRASARGHVVQRRRSMQRSRDVRRRRRLRSGASGPHRRRQSVHDRRLRSGAWQRSCARAGGNRLRKHAGCLPRRRAV